MYNGQMPSPGCQMSSLWGIIVRVAGAAGPGSQLPGPSPLGLWGFGGIGYIFYLHDTSLHSRLTRSINGLMKSRKRIACDS